MFNGKVDDGEPAGYVPFEVRRLETKPLPIIRNGWRIPDVFMPTGHIVVSERVRKVLRSVREFDYRPVRFVKLINTPYAAGDFSYSAGYQGIFDPTRLYETLPDDIRLHEGIDSFFEIVLPYVRRVNGPLNDGQAVVKLKVPFVPFSSSNHEVSQRLIEAWPILDAGYFIFSQAAFDAIAPFLDRDYYQIVEFDI
jgi:hypothetical protein